MFFTSRMISPFLLLALIGAFSSCSSSPTPSENGEASPALETDSKADQVGSIPEDMLADEAPAQNAETTDPTTVAAGDEQAADPFKDLKEENKNEEKPAENLATTETTTSEGESAADTSMTASTSTSSAPTEEYKVKSGDTLMKVAFTIYGDIDRWKDLQEWNRSELNGSKHLRKGMKLKYEAPAEAFSPEKLAHSYTIKKGDTLANIADDVYGKKAKYRKLQNYNKRLIKNPNRIFAGFTIYYDITQKEMAEAEARRQQKLAGTSGGEVAHPVASQNSNEVPSSLNPPVTPSAPAASIAVAPAPTPAAAIPPPPPPPMPSDGLVDPLAPTSSVGQPNAAMPGQ